MKRKYILTLILLFLSTSIILILYCILPKNEPRNAWDQYLLGEYKKMPVGADNPDMAALQNYYMTIDPELKSVPNERLYEAYKYTRKLQSGNPIKPTSLEWTETGSNMGGRTRAIMLDPKDPDYKKVWAGSVTGGLWYNNDIYSNNSGWQVVDDFWPNLSISCMAYDPNDPNTMYAGTGECQTARFIYRESSGVGIGIWKSSDDGETWEIIPSTEDFKYISDLKVRDEDGSSVIYAGVVSGFYHGINFQSEPNDGLYRSLDGGNTWEQVLPDIIGEDLPYAPACIEIGPGGRIFVGTMKNLDGNGGATILYSDQGTIGSWTIFDDYEEIIQDDPDRPIPGRVIIACALSDEDRVYALIGAGYLNSANFNFAQGRYILRSNNGGQSWTQRNLPGGDPFWANLSWHAFIAAVSPSDPDDLYVGGKDVWKTTNGGFFWSHVSDWELMYSGGGDDYVHCDQHEQIYIDNSSSKMLLGCDGGVFYTANASSGNPVFQEKNKGYNTLQFYTCDIYPVTGTNYFVGGLQDNGTLLFTGDPLDVNDMIDVGDGAYCFFDETEPQIMITSTYYNVYTIFYNWNFYDQTGIDGTGVFINPADYDSKNNILYANAVNFDNTYPNRILRISGIPNNPNNQLINLYTGLNTYFSHVKVSPYAPEGTSTLFLGSQNGRLFRVDNAQSNPDVTEISTDDLPVAYVSGIALGGSEDILLVTFTNYGVPSVWQSYNGGTSWEDISGNLPDMPIRWCLYHPQNNKMVMLATEIGIWTTDDASQGEVLWEPEAGIPNVRVDMLQMRTTDNTVLAATHGRGLMYTTWDYDPFTLIAENNEQDIKIFPNPARDYVNIRLASEMNRVMVYDYSGNLVMQQQASGNLCSINTAQLSPGVYVFWVMAEGDVVTKRVVIK